MATNRLGVALELRHQRRRCEPVPRIAYDIATNLIYLRNDLVKQHTTS